MTCAHDWQLRADWSVLCARCGVERDREAGDLVLLPKAPPEPPRDPSPLERAVRESPFDAIDRRFRR